MKHASSAALDTIEDLLVLIRERPGLREPKRGTFYGKSAAFLHFHEDPEGMFADIKEAGEFVRYRVQTEAEKRRFLAIVRAATRRTRGTS